ncbi:TetR family transcriptional regulator [Gordonia alkanivorans]|nr:MULTISPECIES: TetR family transcriptional regulator [Gordonia]AZZ82718.1 TetR family transcriptional regulator [Gordonia alkanivorans]MDH3009005.1 TetR family transcriptional regulator [Gordonia alkanivorans]MDH3013412.1 TetR family transcriptional regulator [Gordonia alkanivorans]MDH3017954.1 TetR family transcriptional regulator [Gordonia alkanivorans]MDH3022313.1 TetR family transcriptional regulator [Gordonia alkanivorans]
MRMPVEERRELLLESAFRVIARRGVDGATTRAICAEAGVTLSTFHYVFATRDELLEALVERGTEKELTAVGAALGEGAQDISPGRAGVVAILQSALSAYIDGVQADPDREQAMISLNQYARQTDGLSDLGAQMYLRYYEAIADALDGVAAATGTAWDRASADLAPLVLAATDGITLSFLNIRDRAICDLIADAVVANLSTHIADNPETTQEKA